MFERLMKLLGFVPEVKQSAPKIQPYIWPSERLKQSEKWLQQSLGDEQQTNKNHGTTVEGFAYTNGPVKLLPLCAKNSNGTVNVKETIRLIEEAERTFDDYLAADAIPADKVDAVISQIIGAGQAYGITVWPVYFSR